MRVVDITKGQITVAFSPEELAFLCNAVNELLEAIEEWEFQTRTGETRKSAVEMMTQLRRLLDDAEHR